MAPYAKLWRRNHLGLLYICKRIRQEAEGVFYKKALFVVGSSQYSTNEPTLWMRAILMRPALDSLIRGAIISGMTLRRIQKLLVITTLHDSPDKNNGGQARVADMRWVQSMTGLQHTTVVFTNLMAFPDASVADQGTYNNASVRVIVESVPISTMIHFGQQSAMDDLRNGNSTYSSALIPTRRGTRRVDRHAI